MTDNGLGLIASPALHATLTFPNPNDVVLGIAVDFNVTASASTPTSRPSRKISTRFSAPAWAASDPVLLGLLNVDSIDEFKNALDQLSPELYSDAEIAALYSSLAFSNSLLQLQGQRHRHRLDHPRGPVPVGRRQRTLPQQPARRVTRSASRRRPGCSPPAPRSRSTTSGGSAPPPATRRARCRRRPARRAKARWRKPACRSSTIRVRCCSPAR